MIINHNHVVLAVLALSLLGFSSRAEADTTLSDSTFSSGWSGAYLSGSSDGTVTFINPTSGGDPGSFGEMSVTGPSGLVDVGIFSSNLVYDAATEGAMTSLTVSFDYEQLSSNNITVQFFAMQSGFDYQLGLSVGGSKTWAPFSETFSVPANALLNTEPVEFGFGDEGYSAVSNDGAVGIDNLVITVSTPEPSTYAMMLGGLALLAFCIRRKLALVSYLPARSA